MASLGYNIEFPIYKEDDSLSGLVLHKSVVDSVVMSLGDKISGDVYVDGDIDLTMREYILYKDVKYTLVNPPTKVREGMVSDNSDLRGMTKYSFEFYHPMYQLSNMPFTDVAVSDDEKQYKSQDKIFSWVGYLADYVAKLNKNLQYSEWVVILNDNISEDKLAKMSDVLSFDKNTIADALKTCYDTWEVPFVIDQLHANEYHDEDDNDYYAQGKRFVILFGLPSNEILDTDGQPFVFKFGQGVGLKNNSATSKNNKIITRIAGYGSEDNIPYGYPQIEWTGNQSWEYTINNRSGMQDVVIDGKTVQAMSYPIYDGIVGGRYVKLIKHPFTRTHLMPSIYAIRVNKKVNPLADGYNPDIEIIDYYDADNDSFANQINPLAPSFEIHEFPDVKPELGEARIIDAYPYNEELAGAIPYSDYESEINTIINNESDNDEKSLLSAFRTWVSTKTSKTNPDHNPIDVVVGDVHYSVLSYEKYVSALYASDKHSLSYKVFIGDNDDSASWDDSMDMDGNYKQSYFKIQLPILSFDLYASAAITQKMDINMRSGACIGCTFPIQVDWEDYKKNFYDENGDFAPSGSQRDLTKYPNSQDTSIVVIVEKDLNTFGTLMPNIYQQPKANDQFVILGISLPTSYITTAEHKLDDDMITYMRENNVYYFDYPLKFDEYMLSQRTDILSQIRNNTVLRFELVEDEQIALYVKQITIKYGEKVLPQYDITLTDDVEIVLNKIGQVTEDVSRMRVQVSDIYKYYNRNFDQRFLRKDKSDSTNYKLTLGELEVLRSTTIGGDLNVQGDTSLNNTNISRGSDVSFGRDGDYIENEQGGRVSVDANGLVRAQVDYLQVNRKMTAKEVEIQEVTHLGGKVLYTAARMKCVKAEEVTAIIQQRRVVVGYKCYFENDDGEGQHIYNQFRVGDQAYCETWNLGGGTSTDFSNQFYWRLVTQVGDDYIVLSADDCASGSTTPRAGDDIVQLGYRQQASDTDAEAFARQGAIIQTAAESVIDGDKISVPSISLFKGINSYVLPNPFILLSPSESHISSTTINLESGKTLDELVEQSYEVYQSEYNSKEDADAIEQEMADLVASWTTPEDVRDEHVGDFFLAADGFCWMYYRDEETDPATYLWRTVDDEYLTAYVNEIAKRTKTFVYGIGEQPYQPNVTYKVGDIWADVDMTFPPTQTSAGVKYDKITLVCISARAKGDDFSIAHWKEWDGTRQLVVNQSATIQQIENNIGDIDASIGSINTSIGEINQGLWVGTDLVWYEAVKNPTGSPKAQGYYELDTYNKPQETKDTSVISGKTYYERKEKQRAGLVTTDDFAGLLAQNDVGTKAEISVSLQAAKNYTDDAIDDVKDYISVATIQADKVIIGTNDNNKRLNEVLVVQGNYVRAQNLAVEGFLNRGVAELEANKISNIAFLHEDTTPDVRLATEETSSSGIDMVIADGIVKTSGSTIYSFDMLLAPDTLRFTGEWQNTDFVLPFYADLGIDGETDEEIGGETIRSSLYYQRPLTNYQKTSGNATRMTLAQMRALIGRRLYIHNNSTTALGLVFHIGIWFKEYAVNVLTSDGTTTAWAKSVSDEDLVEVVEYNQAYERYRHKVSVEQGKTLVLEFCAGVYNAKVGNDIVATECLYWKIIRENAAQLNEFIDA